MFYTPLKIKQYNTTKHTLNTHVFFYLTIKTLFSENIFVLSTPTPDQSLGITWPEFDNSSRQYVEIGDQLTVGAHYKAEVIRFWSSVFENAGVEF